MLRVRETSEFLVVRLMLCSIYLASIRWPVLLAPLLGLGGLLAANTYLPWRSWLIRPKPHQSGHSEDGAAGVREPRPPTTRPPRLTAYADLPKV